MSYITVAIYAVPTAKKDEFIAHSKELTPLFTKHGALAAIDAWGDDVPEGETTSFPMAVKCGADETVAYSHVIWPDKETHDANMSNVMTAMQQATEDNPMPFDGKRMIFASFQQVVEA
ncbi:DUF1428 domain-containing protein [Litoreibacter roseus]|uniref:DUF1428 domain-containing protein n=1 Tax=Litoreibacter roseus TaxID=2601869 RepID=A0A6N6JFH1_9RHOB|nr:DUF1428 domain-containing protein [Litoreibacter roseus]GFE65113.1 hypothetical protein KIN_21870 [Litoreibacter roseus]